MRLSLYLIPILLLGMSTFAEAAKITAIFVDKSKNELHVTELKNGVFEIQKTYHTTTGKVKGDKEQEGDLKTPEGIYILTSKLLPPTIKPKFGKMAFMLNYPNAYDRIAGRSGFDIMLHATDEPERLKQNYDSEGCVVLKNEEIGEVQNSIRLGLTPILIYPEFKPEYLKVNQDAKITEFFNSWVADWEGKNIDPYISHYHSEFNSQGMDRDHWKAFKTTLNKKYKKIEVNPKDIVYYQHPKYWMITFTQNYKSHLSNDRIGLHSQGTKILFVAEEDGKLKIISETFSQRMW